jgi:hypothetical protein
MLGPRQIEPLRLFRTLAVHESLAASMLAMHSRILAPQAALQPVLREVMIHRTSHRAISQRPTALGSDDP